MDDLGPEAILLSVFSRANLEARRWTTIDLPSARLRTSAVDCGFNRTRERTDHIAMHAQEFDELFDEIVARPLTVDGFQKKGKSLYRDDGNCQFAWIRGGGRLSAPGTVSHIVGFRHSFLRRKSGDRPVSAPHDAGDYPWVFSCESLVGSKSTEWLFDPVRLMSLPFGRMVYSALSVDEAITALNARRSAFLEYVSWARALTLADAHGQIESYVSEYWIARLWDEDYRVHLTV